MSGTSGNEHAARAGRTHVDFALSTEAAIRSLRSVTAVVTSFEPDPTRRAELMTAVLAALIVDVAGNDATASIEMWAACHALRLCGARVSTIVSTSSVDPCRFIGKTGRGTWSSPPRPWHLRSDEASGAVLSTAMHAIDAMPVDVQLVIRLRDVERWSADDVCRTLSIGPGRERALLHHGRSCIREALENSFGDTQ